MKIRIVSLLLVGIIFLSQCRIIAGDYEEKNALESSNEVGLLEIEDEAVALASADSLGLTSTKTASNEKIKENDYMAIDYSNATDGYIRVKYKKSTSVKLKSQVKGPKGTTYTYNLTPKKWAVFPLTEGNGTYNVYVYKNISGNSYASVGAHSFKVNMEDTMAPFKRANQYVNYTSKSKCVKKASSLCKGVSKEMKKVEKIYKWTLDYFKYDTKKAKNVKSGYLPDLDEVYKAKKGICFDYAATMVAMLRSQKVPAKLVIGYAGKVYHAWINVYTKKDGWVTGVIFFDGKNWNIMDPTFADSAGSSKEILDFISNEKNYKEKYVY